MEINLKGSDLHPTLGAFFDRFQRGNEQNALSATVSGEPHERRIITVTGKQIDLAILNQEYQYPENFWIHESSVKRSGANVVLTLSVQIVD